LDINKNLLIIEYINTLEDVKNLEVSYDENNKKYEVKYLTDINLGGIRIRLLDPQKRDNNIDVKTIYFITSGSSPYQISLSA